MASIPPASSYPRIAYLGLTRPKFFPNRRPRNRVVTLRLRPPPVPCCPGRRMDPDQHLVILEGGSVHLREPENIRWPVFFLYDCLHCCHALVSAPPNPIPVRCDRGSFGSSTAGPHPTASTRTTTCPIWIRVNNLIAPPPRTSKPPSKDHRESPSGLPAYVAIGASHPFIWKSYHRQLAQGFASLAF